MRLCSGIVPLLLLLSACSESSSVPVVPREPGADATGFYCRMNLAEHKGPKGQVLLKGWDEPLWFSSVRDALTYAQSEIVSEKEIAGFWVNDMAQGTWEKPAPGSWVIAQAAHYVVGSNKTAGMGGSEAVPFRDRSDAESFANENGGSVADYARVLRWVASVAAELQPEGGGT